MFTKWWCFFLFFFPIPSVQSQLQPREESLWISTQQAGSHQEAHIGVRPAAARRRGFRSPLNFTPVNLERTAFTRGKGGSRRWAGIYKTARPAGKKQLWETNMRDFLTARDVFKRSAFDLWAAATSDRMLPRTREKPQISEVLRL